MKAISITSGKGGVGKSIVATNLGLALAKSGKKVLLFDADLSLANLDVLFGLKCEFNLMHVIEGSKELPEIVMEAPFGLHILPAASGVLKMERLEPPQLARISLALQELANQYDILLIDTGAGLTETVLFFNTSVDEILLVTTPDPTALTDAYALLKVMNTNYGVGHVIMLVNQVQTTSEGLNVYQRLKQVCGNYLTLQLADGGQIPRDSELEAAVRSRKPLLLANPDCPASRQFLALANRFDRLFRGTNEGLNQEFWGRFLGGGSE
jgi:flagellar biosynthesis protein FlhG